jgi:hypothetical protein
VGERPSKVGRSIDEPQKSLCYTPQRAYLSQEGGEGLVQKNKPKAR